MAPQASDSGFHLRNESGVWLLRLVSSDTMNRLTRCQVTALTAEIVRLSALPEPAQPLVICGEPNFSAGADLNEIRALSGPVAFDFARMGQALMQAVQDYPAIVTAAIHGHCMGGGMDLALACHRRVAAPEAIFGHRGAALGLITGWGGTQRLPRLIGKGRALELFAAAEKIAAGRALRIGLIDAIAADPVAESFRTIPSAGRFLR